MDFSTIEKVDGRRRYNKEYYIPLFQTQLSVFFSENKQFTEFEFTTGNDLETSEVPLSVLFCIIEKNAFSDCKGNECFSIGKVVKDRMQDGSWRGLIRDSCYKYFWSLSYSSAKTTRKRMDKLEKAGIRCKLTDYNGGYIEFPGYTP